MVQEMVERYIISLTNSHWWIFELFLFFISLNIETVTIIVPMSVHFSLSSYRLFSKQQPVHDHFEA